MTLSWTLLTPQQQQALSALRAGHGRVDSELLEQLRNLGLAEIGTSGVAVSMLGEAILPTSVH
jgi:ribosomal protein S19E (S16A)